MKKSTLNESFIYTEFEQLESLGSTRRQCNFICENCGKQSNMALDRLLLKKALLCRRCSTERTCIKAYGVRVPYMSETVREKGKRTCLKNHGVEYSGQTEKAKKAASENLAKKETRTKIKETCIKRYGVPSYTQTNDFKRTMSEYFKDPSHVSERNTKTEATKLERYGDRFFNNPTKNEETCMKKYGVKHCLLNKQVSQKAHQAFKDKYGCNSPSQLPGYVSSKKYVIDNIHFDSSWEVMYYNFLKRSTLDFIAHPKIRLEYYYKNEKHFYMPDFLVNGKFVEIKGNHFFNEKGWLINPWNRNQDGLYRAKHECMIKNNVKVIKYHELKEIIK